MEDMEELAFMSCEDRNYYRDRRVSLEYVPDPPEGTKFHYEVCDVCAGRGKTVNPSIDANGLSAEDFREDPDFADDYFSGAYDVQCQRCRGRRVIPVLDEAEDAHCDDDPNTENHGEIVRMGEEGEDQ